MFSFMPFAGLPCGSAFICLHRKRASFLMHKEDEFWFKAHSSWFKSHRTSGSMLSYAQQMFDVSHSLSELGFWGGPAVDGLP